MSWLGELKAKRIRMWSSQIDSQIDFQEGNLTCHSHDVAKGRLGFKGHERIFRCFFVVVLKSEGRSVGMLMKMILLYSLVSYRAIETSGIMIETYPDIAREVRKANRNRGGLGESMKVQKRYTTVMFHRTTEMEYYRLSRTYS